MKKASKNIHSITGSGHFTFMDELRTFSFAAGTGKDGAVKGQAQTKNRASGSKRHIAINCISDLGEKSALVGGVVTKSNNASEIGGRVVFAVEDNGQGALDPPDRLTGLFFLPSNPAIPDCAQPPFEPPFIDVEKGNIQVKTG